MIIVRKSEERHHSGNQNQKTWMTFNSANKADPLQNGFGVLKILNEEILSPGSGFILHTHKDMVVVTYVREGIIIYKSPLEKPGLVEINDFHRINLSADSVQSAVNVSTLDEAHVFQSAFTPGTDLLEAGGEKKIFTLTERKGILKLIASPDGKEASLKIQQDVQIYSTLIHRGNHMIHEIKPGRSAWLHVVKGRILMNERMFSTGDGAGFSGEMAVSFTAQEPTEILLFDLVGQVPETVKTTPKKKQETVEIG
jgi:redox-sensitive bicupin YhaK (pirin superfamily)